MSSTQKDYGFLINKDIKLYIENKPAFKLVKKDSDTAEKIANVEFTIYELDKDGNQVDFAKNINNEYSIGLYIRDKILGIGTMTFITEDNYFASLGHGIYDNNVLLNSVNNRQSLNKYL